MSAAKASSEGTVAKTLASGAEMAGAEIAAATGLGRSTVGKALAALERGGLVRRHAGGHDGRRRLPDRWSIGHPARPGAQRLRSGQLDGLVLEYIDPQGTDAVGATAVAKALGRSAGAVGNCLTRLAAAGRVRQVSDKPRRYSSAASESRTRGRTSRPRKERS